MQGGTGVMGSPPSLPGAEQEAEQVVFPWREKAAYVPGSLACGAGADARDSPDAGGRHRRTPRCQRCPAGPAQDWSSMYPCFLGHPP